MAERLEEASIYKLQEALSQAKERIKELEQEIQSGKWYEETGGPGLRCCDKCDRRHPHGCLLPLQARAERLAAALGEVAQQRHSDLLGTLSGSLHATPYFKTCPALPCRLRTQALNALPAPTGPK